MTTVAVLGGGGGGRSAVVELLIAGHRVHLWNRRAQTISSILDTGTFGHRGVMGEGTARPQLVTTELAEALDGAECVVVCLPSLAHDRLFHELALLRRGLPIVLNPGHTGGALHARAVWQRLQIPLPPIVEFSTLTYVARVDDSGTVDTTGRAGTVRAAPLPGGGEALACALELFPGTTPVDNVLASSLANVNLVLHAPGAVLALAWSEATHGDFRFYVDAMTPGVGQVLRALDEERLAVGQAFGLRLLPLHDEMAAIGTVDPGPGLDIVEAIRAGEANSRIRGPDSTEHRYYREDFPFGLLPFTELAQIAGVEVPVARALLQIASTAIGPDLLTSGRNAHVLGIDGIDPAELLASIDAGEDPRMENDDAWN